MKMNRRIVALGMLVALAGGAVASRAQGQQEVSKDWSALPMPKEHVIVIVPQRRLPTPNVKAAYLEAADVEVTIKDQVATTTLQLSLRNPTDSAQEAEILLPIPEGVVVRSLQYDGVGPEPMAKVLPRDEARQIYDEIVRRTKDPALVEFAGTNVIRTSAFPIPPNTMQKLSLTFEQVLPVDGDRVDYWLPRSESLASSGVKWTIRGTIESSRKVASMYSQSHEIESRRDRSGRLKWRVAAASIEDAERGSFRLSYLLSPAKGGLSWTMLAYPDSKIGKDGDGGYFLLMAALPPTDEDAPKVKREVILVIDRSGSMRGEKMAQAQAAALQVIEGLEEGEAFNIIDYSDSIGMFSETPVLKEAETMKAAQEYVSSIKAGGGTNIQESLAEALRMKPTKGMLPLVLFMTDGLPTVGERNEVAIRESAKKENKYNRRIFTFGVGYDVNSPLLSNIAKTSRAVGTFVLPQEDVEVKVSQVFRRLSGPVLGLPKLKVLDSKGTLGGRVVRELMPGELGDVFEGDQVLVLGQYTKEGLIHLGLEGDFRGERVMHTFTVDTRQATKRNGQVPRLWARAKVASLIDEVRQAGAEGTIADARLKELTDEIVELSTTWGILTEYTSFLAAPENMLGAFAANGQYLDPSVTGRWESSERLRQTLREDTSKKLAERAIKDRDGAGGVNQERNIDAMKAGAPASPTRYAYVDADMKEVEITTIQQVADLTLLNRKNRWVDARILEKEDEKPDVVVEFGTDAYFTLVTELTRDGRQGVLSNAGDLYILHNNQRVLVKGAS